MAGGTRVNLVLVAVVYVALAFGAVTGLLAGTAGGLAQDALAGGIVGIGGLSKTIVGFLVGVLGAQFIVSQPLPRFVMFVGATFAARAAVSGAVRAGRVAGRSRCTYSATLIQAVVNGGVGIAAFLLVEQGPDLLQRRQSRAAFSRRRYQSVRVRQFKTTRDRRPRTSHETRDQRPGMSTSTPLMPDDRRSLTLRLSVLQYIVALLFAALAVAFWVFQIAQHEKFREMAEKNHLRRLPLPAPRGVLLDRHGKILVENQNTFNIALVREQTKNLDQTLRVLALRDRRGRSGRCARPSTAGGASRATGRSC